MKQTWCLNLCSKEDCTEGLANSTIAMTCSYPNVVNCRIFKGLPNSSLWFASGMSVNHEVWFIKDFTQFMNTFTALYDTASKISLNSTIKILPFRTSGLSDKNVCFPDLYLNYAIINNWKLNFICVRAFIWFINGRFLRYYSTWPIFLHSSVSASKWLIRTTSFEPDPAGFQWNPYGHFIVSCDVTSL